jgi:hypothetical protein
MTRLQALEAVVQRMRTIVAAREAEKGEGPMTRLARCTAAVIAALDALPADPDPAPAEVEQAHSYLARLLQNTHPQCEPLPDLWGLCTQIDNMVTEIPKLRAEVKRLREALSPLVAVIPDICNALDVDPDETSISVRVDGGARDGEVLAERTLADMLTVARAALAKEPSNEG